MSDKPQQVATGAFVMGALLIAIVTLLYLAGSGFSNKERFVMVFDSAAKGLNIGAPLALRGIQVGQVTGVNVVIDADTAEVFVVVEAEIDVDRIHYRGSPGVVEPADLVERGLRAQLNMQSLVTGLLYIEMDFHPGSEIKLVDIDSPLPQFPTTPTNLEQLAKKLSEFNIEALAEKLEKISEGVESLLGSEELQQLPANLNQTLVTITELGAQVQEQLAHSGPRLDAVLEQTSSAISNANTELTEATDAFQESMQQLDKLLSNDSATIYQLNKALNEVSKASRSLRQLANTLENQPEALLKGKGGGQ
jgi:paraquat-inducible protein B